MTKLRVLVLEGEPTLRTCLGQALVKNYQCRVQRAVGIVSQKPLVILTPRGKPKLLNGHFDVAFLDDCSENTDYGELVEMLSKRKTVCIGLSFSKKWNEAMVACGAYAACGAHAARTKPFVVAAVMLAAVPCLKGPPIDASKLAEQLEYGERLYREPDHHKRVSEAFDLVRKGKAKPRVAALV